MRLQMNLITRIGRRQHTCARNKERHFINSIPSTCDIISRMFETFEAFPRILSVAIFIGKWWASNPIQNCSRLDQTRRSSLGCDRWTRRVILYVYTYVCVCRSGTIWEEKTWHAEDTPLSKKYKDRATPAVSLLRVRMSRISGYLD